MENEYTELLPILTRIAEKQKFELKVTEDFILLEKNEMFRNQFVSFSFKENPCMCGLHLRHLGILPPSILSLNNSPHFLHLNVYFKGSVSRDFRPLFFH